ncbi:PHP domain-containing protein, partial [Pseudomonadota bacterium]|nr:PHP domain-containing protein [Pseudomonadota bacterium]
MLFDLHNHSIFSYDAFSSESEIIDACVLRGISAIAITEHDEVCKLSYENFKKAGIELIPGREYTSDRGAHIIGLFITEEFHCGTSREEIAQHIKKQGGLMVMPHPWKPGSGYMDKYSEDNFIQNFDFIELLNGGWSSRDYTSKILRLSENYSLRMLASSDSHRGCQVGLCVTKINSSRLFSVGDAKQILVSARQQDIDLLIDNRMLLSKGRKTRKIQLSKSYQKLLPLFPTKIRRLLKIFYYRLSKDR